MTPTIELLPHNQKLYDNIVKQIESGERSIFYSEATGLGKSFIFMRLIQDYFAGKRIMYIVPKIAIWENLIHYDEFNQLDCTIEMRTFVAFNTYDSDEKLFEEYDAVFVDECHHMLSDVQGMNVAIFLDDMVNSGKYAFGLTATPKYNDIYVDEMYFNVSCYGYDVFDAIKYGLYPKIDIAIADIDFREIPVDLQKKYSVSGTKSVLEQVIDERSDITHWLAYFGRIEDLESNEHELKSLFPEFKVIKLYNGINDPRSVIKEFEEYSGKIILMSVSMLLEGMHLNNVGGVLLYRSVIRTSTYFQIYGRLCKMGAKKSPLLLDITNSIMQISDFGIFKSSRARTSNIQYSRRDLFDVTSRTYRYIELSDEMNPFKRKEYRGVEWTSLQSLDRAMGNKCGAVSAYLNADSKKSCESYIDSKLQDSTYEEYVKDGFVGRKSIRIGGVEYKIVSLQELSDIFGRPAPRNYDRSSLDSFARTVEWELSHGCSKGVVYRSVDISNMNTISKFMNIHYKTIMGFISQEGIDVKECVDMYLDEDKRYKGIMLVDGINYIHRKTSIIKDDIRIKYKELGSMTKLIDYYLVDDARVYRGVTIGSKYTISDVARQLNIAPGSFQSMKKKNNYTIEQCIDYYIDSGKVVINKDGSVESFSSTREYLREEFNLITSMHNEGYDWSTIAKSLNNLECNKSRRITRRASNLSSGYNALRKKMARS